MDSYGAATNLNVSLSLMLSETVLKALGAEAVLDEGGGGVATSILNRFIGIGDEVWVQLERF